MKTILGVTALSLLAGISSSQSTLDDYRNILKENPRSSLAHYGIGEIYLRQQKYQEAADEFHKAIQGDLKPKWTEVWSHIDLGKVFDVQGQRARAMNQYTAAIQTKDDTNGAMKEASKYLKSPYKP